jgi:hypothetical protein
MGTRIESRLPDQATLDEFVAVVRAGNFIKTACGFTGIAESTFYAWATEDR